MRLSPSRDQVPGILRQTRASMRGHSAIVEATPYRRADMSNGKKGEIRCRELANHGTSGRNLAVPRRHARIVMTIGRLVQQHHPYHWSGKGLHREEKEILGGQTGSSETQLGRRYSSMSWADLQEGCPQGFRS